MTRVRQRGVSGIVAAALAVAWCRGAAAQTPRPLAIGGLATDTVVRQCTTDSIVSAALAIINGPVATLRLFGGATINAPINGSLGVFRGNVRIDNTVHGDVVVLDGELRVVRTGIVTGRIMVLGGHLSVDPGATVGGTTYQCDQPLALTREADGTVTRAASAPSLHGVTSALTWYAGTVRLRPHIGIGQYNRVEGLPGEIGINAAQGVGSNDSLTGSAYGIVRTARDPSGSRPSVGWFATGRFSHNGWLPYAVSLDLGSTVQATEDRPFPPTESGLSALVLRRDYTDWYLDRGARLAVTLLPANDVALTGAFQTSHQTTVLASDAFSFFRNGEAWRPNPLIDDGHYRIVSGLVTWDARSERDHPVLSWLFRAGVRHTTSYSLTPVALPTLIRDPLPTTGYGSTSGEIDLRAYLRLNPETRVAVRIVGGGYLGGDPLTVQDREAIGGADPFLGYDFRQIHCDRRRKIDPAVPALCDRTAAVQAEYHRTLPIDLSSNIAGYTVGLRHPELVLLGDIGSAWLAGDSAGRVPAGKIQALREWHSEIGVGITTGTIGLYFAKAVSDALPARFTLLFSPRF